MSQNREFKSRLTYLLTKVQRQFNRERLVFLTMGAGTTGHLYVRNRKYLPYLPPYITINSEWITGSTYKTKNCKTSSRKQRRKNSCNLR